MTGGVVIARSISGCEA